MREGEERIVLYERDEMLKQIEALQQENEQLKDENISIRKWNKFVDEDYPKLLEENKRLQYTLIGVMHSVDKWFDEADESVDEVNRAAQAREIALQAIEKRDAALKKAREAIKAAWSDGSANAAMDKASEALTAIDKAIGGKEDYPCTDHDCYDKGNYHTGCESCPKYKKVTGGKEDA